MSIEAPSPTAIDRALQQVHKHHERVQKATDREVAARVRLDSQPTIWHNVEHLVARGILRYQEGASFDSEQNLGMIEAMDAIKAGEDRDTVMRELDY